MAGPSYSSWHYVDCTDPTSCPSCNQNTITIENPYTCTGQESPALSLRAAKKTAPQSKQYYIDEDSSSSESSSSSSSSSDSDSETISESMSDSTAIRTTRLHPLVKSRTI